MLQWTPILAKVQPHQRVQVTKRGSGICLTMETNFISSILDEIALEGLDGITLPSLWLRLGTRKGFTYKMKENIQPFLWQNAIAIQSEVEFYELPTPRPDLCLPPPIEREEEFIEQKYYEDNTSEIYPFMPVETDSVRGSCSTFHSRKKVTSRIRDKEGNMLMDLNQVKKTWDLKQLAIVASQNARTGALYGDVNPDKAFSIKQYCMLEIIGRTRSVGNIPKPRSQSSHMNEDSKTAFYLRKDLLETGVIVKQAFHLNRSFVTLLHLKRFYSWRQSKLDILIEKTIQILEAKPNHSEDFLKDTYMEESGPSTAAKSKAKRKGKKVKIIELIKPVKMEEPEEEEEEEEEVVEKEEDVDNEKDEEIPYFPIYSANLPLAKTTRQDLKSHLNSEKKTIKQEAAGSSKPYSRTFSSSNLTHRQVKRANLICEMVKQSQVIDGIFKIEKMIHETEKKEGIDYRVDKKSVTRLLEMLHRDGYIKMLQTVITYSQARKVLHFICDPSIQVNDPILKAKIDQSKLRISSYTKQDLSRVKAEQRAALNAASQSQASSSKPQPWLKTESKFGKLRILHQYLFYLIYDYQGDTSLVGMKGKNKVYNPSQDWKMFIPPLTPYKDYPQGWAFIQDLTFHMPLSIFASLVPSEFKFTELGEYLRDPVKKHYIILDLPPKITSLFMSTRNYVFHLFCIFERLCFCGMATLGPPILKEKDQIFLYLHRKLSIKNTKISQPGYLHITPNISYPVDSYQLESLSDVDEYWFDLETTCLSTPLGSFSCSTDCQEERIERRQQLLTETTGISIEKVLDDGHIPGDGVGAGGLDSSLFSHLKRNWTPPSMPTLPPATRGLKLIGPPSYGNEKIKVSKGKYMSRTEKHSLTSKAKQPRKRTKKKPVATEPQQPKPQPSKKKHKSVSDAVDKETVKKRRIRRAEWSTKEDTILLLSKVASLFFMPKSRKLVVPYTVVRDLLHKYTPTALKNKTSVVCRSRLRHLLMDHSTFLNVSSLLGEALQDPDLRKKYFFKERLPATQEEEWKQRFISLFEDLYNKFTQGTIQKKDIGELPDHYADLREKYNVVVACSDQDLRVPSLEPQDMDGIRRGILHAVIFSALNNIDDKFNWNVTYIYINQSFKNDSSKIFNEVEHLFSTHKIISKKTENAKRFYFVPYRLAFRFLNFMNAKFCPNIYEDSFNFVQELESAPNDPFVINTDLSMARVISILSLIMSGHLEFSIKVPFTHMLVNWDNKPTTKSTSTSITQLLCMQENPPKKGEAQDVLHPSEFTFHLQSSGNLQQRMALYKEIVENQRRLLPLEIGTSPTDLLKHFSDSPDLPELEALHQMILEGREYGLPKSEILRRYPVQQHSRVVLLLKMLTESHVVIYAGIDVPRYIDQQFSGPWVIDSFVIPKDERLKACELSQKLMKGGSADLSLQELEAPERAPPVNWKKVKFLMRAWKKPDGSLNRASFHKILENVLSHIVLTGCCSMEGILDRYAASYQRFQVWEILDILETLECIYTQTIPKTAPITLDSCLEDSWECDKEEVFYFAHCNSMIKLGQFFNFLIKKHAMGSFDGDFLSAILDEVALEGLDGITLPTLWMRLSERPRFPLKQDNHSKAFIWNCMASHPEVEFFELPQPRPTLAVFNRYKYVDSELGIVFEPETLPEDLYPIKVIDDNGIRGSCATYLSRQNVTSCIRDGDKVLLSLAQAEAMWGQALVLVASQSSRWKALVGSEANPQLELSAIQFCMLERIGRSRYMGEVTLGKLGLSCLNENPKTLHYLRKLLVREKLITKQMHFQRNHLGQTGSGSLLHVARFHTERQSKMGLMLQKICVILEQKPNQREIISKLREEVGMKNTSFKKIFHKPFQNCVRTRVISYREFYKDADGKEALTQNGKERTVRVAELIHPFGEQEDEEEDEEDKDMGGGWVLDPRNFIRDQPLLVTAYNIVEGEGPEGITAQMLGRKLGLPKLETRQLCRNLDRRGVVISYMQDIGRQRVTKFVSKYFVNDSKDHNKFLEEKRRILAFSANLQAEQTVAAADDPLHSELFIPTEPALSPQASSSGEPSSSTKPQKTLRNSLTADLISSYGCRKKKDAPHITYRVLKRANMIIEAVKSARLIDDLYKLQKMIIKAESAEGYAGKVDKKSMQRLVKKLHQDGLVRSIKTVLRLGDQEKKFHFVCDPSLTPEDSLEQMRQLLPDDADTSITKSLKDLHNLCMNIPVPSKMEYDHWTPNFYGTKSKFGKLRHVYLYLFYLIYDYQGQEDLPPLEGHKPRQYNTEDGWKRFVPPLPLHAGYPRGWALISDIILSMPLSVFMQIAHFCYNVEGLEAMLKDPIRQHYLLRQLPIPILSGLVYNRHYILNIYAVLTHLSFCGMLSFGPQQLKEKEQVFIYLHHKLAIKNTTYSPPHAHVISPDVVYPNMTFTLGTLREAEEYWKELERICLNTPLCYPTQAQEVVSDKPALREATRNKEVKEVVDDHIIPGDGLGAGGLDSSLGSYIHRNWRKLLTFKDTSSYLNKKIALKNSAQDEPDGPPRKKRLNNYKARSLFKTNLPKRKAAKRKAAVGDENAIPQGKKAKKNRKAEDLAGEAEKKDEIRFRVDWSSQEDSCIFICKVASLYLNPKALPLVVSFDVVLSLLKKYCPQQAKTKTLVSCKRRLNKITRNQATSLTLTCFLGEINQDDFLRKNFAEKMPLSQGPELNALFTSLFDHLFKKVMQGNQVIIPSLVLPDTWEELKNKFNLEVASPASQKHAPPSFAVTKEEDIKGILYHALVFSIIHLAGDKNNWDFLSTYLCNKLSQDDADMASALENLWLVHRIIKKGKNPMPLSHSKFSHSFLLSTLSGMPQRFFLSIQQNIQRLEKSSSPIKANLTMSDTEMFSLLSLLVNRVLDFSISYPKEPFQIDQALSWLKKARESSQAFKKKISNVDSFPLQPSEIQLKVKSQSLLQDLEDHTYRQVVDQLRKTLPLTTEAKPLEKAYAKEVHQVILEAGSLGISLSDLQVKFSPPDKLKAILQDLENSNHVVRVGVDSFQYVCWQHGSPWVLESFAIPKDDKSFVHQMVQETSGQMSPKSTETLAEQRHWKKVAFVPRAWRRPDGTLNKRVICRFLEMLGKQITLSACVSQEGLCNRYAVSFQRVQVLEAMEILEKIGCVTRICITGHTTPQTLFSPQPVYNLTTEEEGSSESFYEATPDCSIRLGHFLNHLLTKP
ncbi:GTF3C1 [Cordylochernes scorpioides]|uniref:GTF3C1 n=1 Tax=Cordylochernes scorpioides TaxID=51811 RepID=A0ABY6LAS0_9ARAC|nr:GTF3C1 [Cordylochernes scorpioides]